MPFTKDKTFQYHMEDNSVIITGCSPFNEIVTIPKFIDGKPVTRIAGHTFRTHCNNVKEFLFPETLKSIGSYAFLGCQKLERVIIPNGVTCIEPGAFKECGNLCSVLLPESLEVVPSGCFSGCSSLTNITLPTQIKEVHGYAFTRTNISKITFPKTTHLIGYGAFSYTPLTTIRFEGKFINIAETAFRNIPPNTKIKCVKGSTIDKKYRISIFSNCKISHIASEMSNFLEDDSFEKVLSSPNMNFQELGDDR